jgi:NADPH:quinone reductase-like Zn-dependent oxidoreductase
VAADAAVAARQGLTIDWPMKAIFIQQYGGTEVLQYGEQPMPAIKPHQVLVRVHAASVNPRDWLLREGKYVFRHVTRGFPLILGSDISGVVEQVGAAVKHLRVGDAVFGMQGITGRLGAYAQYTAINETSLAIKPDDVSHVQAAAVPCAGLTAYAALMRMGRVKSGANVLIVGASGGVGSYAVQLAKAAGANVTAVASTNNIALVRELGADEVIDYKTQDFRHAVRDQDVIFDVMGRENLTECRKVLRAGGRYITTIPNGSNALAAIGSGLRRAFKASATSSHMVLVRARGDDLAIIAALMLRGLVRSVIDSTYPLANAAQAQTRSRSWRSRGKIVLTLD